MTPAAEPQSRYESLRFILVFLVLFGGMFGVLTYWDLARREVVEPWTTIVAQMASALLGLFDRDVSLAGNIIIGRGVALSIIDGCNGVTPLALLVAGVLAFPTTWRARGIGLAFGVPAVMVINMVRITALYAIRARFPDWFDESHLYVAQAFVILLTGAVWLWWLTRFAARATPAQSR